MTFTQSFTLTYDKYKNADHSFNNPDTLCQSYDTLIDDPTYLTTKGSNAAGIYNTSFELFSPLPSDLDPTFYNLFTLHKFSGGRVDEFYTFCEINLAKLKQLKQEREEGGEGKILVRKNNL